jgi:hypothetical protein
MRQATFETYAKEAGFDGVSVLPIEHDSFAPTGSTASHEGIARRLR